MYINEYVCAPHVHHYKFQCSYYKFHKLVLFFSELKLVTKKTYLKSNFTYLPNSNLLETNPPSKFLPTTISNS